MRVVSIVGSYRKGGIVDSAVDEILEAAREEGAEVRKVYLIDTRIEFCTNCRLCTQRAGAARGVCPIDDEMRRILDEIEEADAVVLASPMNFWSVTAVMKRFVERLVCYAYWPWGTAAPKPRSTRRDKRAVLVTASAAPAIVGRLATPIVKTLRRVAELLGSKTIGVLYIGLSAGKEHQDIGERARHKARLLGKRLAQGN